MTYNLKVNNRNSKSPKSKKIDKFPKEMTKIMAELLRQSQLNILSPTQTFSHNLIFCPLPIANLVFDKKAALPFDIYTQGPLPDPLLTSAVFHPFLCMPYLLLITRYQKELTSKGNLHSHLPSKALFLLTKFLTLNHLYV